MIKTLEREIQPGRGRRTAIQTDQSLDDHADAQCGRGEAAPPGWKTAWRVRSVRPSRSSPANFDDNYC